MSKTSLTKFKWFWADQDEAQEQWLRTMAQQGWHLRDVNVVWWQFDAGPPADVVYRVDYLSKTPADDYAQLLRDAGWEHAAQASGWHYWRTAAQPGQVQELFTDVPSRRAKFKRLLPTLLLGLCPSLLFLYSAQGRYRLTEELSWPFQVLWIGMLLVIAIGIARLVWRMWKLRQPA